MSTTLIKRAIIVFAMMAIVCALVMIPVGNGGNKAAAVTGIKNFTILHTNDEHSDIYPYALSKDFFTNPANPSTGGFSRLATTIGTIKAQKAAVSEPVLTLGAGDWSQGTLFSWLETGAAPELSLMQMMGYDAVTLGNHNVELGPQYLAAELNAAATGAGCGAAAAGAGATATGAGAGAASGAAAVGICPAFNRAAMAS